MSPIVRLDNVEHHDLRLIAGPAGGADDRVNLALVVPAEFAEVQREYPILFRQAEDGGFQAFALLGLETDENLFLDETGWRARYVPAIQARGPFSIGLRDTGDDEPDSMVMVDTGHPRISRDDGEPLFLSHGGNAPVLERVLQALRTLHAGIAASDAMFAAFHAAGLLAPVNIEIQLDDGARHALTGFFSVSQEACARLDAATLADLNRSGFLALAFYVIHSTANMRRLIDMKTRRHAS
ncbi:SapC family protein [Asticcacaulis solisilvae]|uniref:SapC family protein n=1 Tax=Asticcacaulis solisilvae TaxID=1217274 RepID=UPI003FD81299